jgi:hypothetical protein
VGWSKDGRGTTGKRRSRESKWLGQRWRGGGGGGRAGGKGWRMRAAQTILVATPEIANGHRKRTRGRERGEEGVRQDGRREAHEEEGPMDQEAGRMEGGSPSLQAQL